MPKQDNSRICQVVDLGCVPYGAAGAKQKKAVADVQDGESGELIFLLEHPHVITKGRNAGDNAILADRQFIRRRGVTVEESDRGGDVTYHGPGQLVGYPIILLEPGRRSIRRYIHDLEEVLIRTLSRFGIESGRHPVYRGVWIEGKKIASIGVRISRWVTSHGFALNVNTDLSYFSLIDPCGIAECEMTSMAKLLGTKADMGAVKRQIVSDFSQVFERELAFETIPFPYRRAEGAGLDG